MMTEGTSPCSFQSFDFIAGNVNIVVEDCFLRLFKSEHEVSSLSKDDKKQYQIRKEKSMKMK
jgi:hypothetical protein